MKAALYARVSTVDQQNPETQLIPLRRFAELKGYEVHKEYTDRASGADPHRPALEEMMAAARAREIDVVLVVRIDRIMRSLINLQLLVQELDGRGVGLICIDQPIDTTTAAGRLLFQLLGSFAEFERELIRERVNAGMARARREGTRSGKEIGRPRREVDLELVDAMLAEGRSKRRIAEELGVDRSTITRAMRRRCKREG